MEKLQIHGLKLIDPLDQVDQLMKKVLNINVSLGMVQSTNKVWSLFYDWSHSGIGFVLVNGGRVIKIGSKSFPK